MTRGWLSVAGACALGALIGTLAALEISARFKYGAYFWGIGALLGGIVAYVAIDLRNFCAGVVQSYHKTIAWRPRLMYWKATGIGVVAVGMAVAAITSCIAALAVTLYYLGFNPNGFFIAGEVIQYGALASLVFATLSLPIFLYRQRYWGCEMDYYNRCMQKNITTSRKVLLWWNPLTSPIVFSVAAAAIVVVGVVVVAMDIIAWFGRTAMACVRGGKAFGNFAAATFVYVHSSRRTLCFVDAALGAAIGYSYGSAIVGAIAGVVLGVINYELVSVRWLKLAAVQPPAA